MRQLGAERRSAQGAAAAAEVLTAPTGTVPLLVRPGEASISWIKYETHGAYSEFMASSNVVSRAKALVGFMKYFMVVLIKRLVAYELIPPHLRRPRSIADARDLFLVIVWRRFLRNVTAPPAVAKAELPKRVSEELRQNGCCVIRISDEELQAICAASRELFAELRARRGHSTGGRDFAESRTQAMRIANARLLEVINSCFLASGVLDAASSYLGSNVRLLDVMPQINDRSDDFWRRIFPDISMPLPRAAYLHKDASSEIKAILYLSDVGPTGGPFSFIVNSHRLKATALGNWIEETNDHAGYSGTEPRGRRAFASLPRFLRRKCAFGNDISDDNPVSERLLAAEWKIMGARGTLIVFDTKGIHRGGMVEQGEREVISCVVG